MQQLSDFDIAQQRVMIRVDFNVPIHRQLVTNDARILAHLPVIRQAMQANAKVILLSHRGRPVEGQRDPEFSLAPVAQRLTELLGLPVRLVTDWLSGIDVKAGEVVLCENVRFLTGESKNDPELAQKMASLCDIFVLDAFATAHRAQASTVGVAQYAAKACAGPLLIAEIQALDQALEHPQRPLVAVVGGAKVSTKLMVLEHLAKRVDQLIVGGGMANTFLAAKGINVGNSLYEPELLPVARELMSQLQDRNAQLPLPTDVIVASELSSQAVAETKPVEHVEASRMILDIGPKTAQNYCQLLKTAGSIIWNGPVGVFEIPQFSHGTKQVAKAIAASSAFSLAGGGDTMAAIEQLIDADDINYISTGGGAFLEYLGGRVLPGLAVLQQKEMDNVN